MEKRIQIQLCHLPSTVNWTGIVWSPQSSQIGSISVLCVSSQLRQRINNVSLGSTVGPYVPVVNVQWEATSPFFELL